MMDLKPQFENQPTDAEDRALNRYARDDGFCRAVLHGWGDDGDSSSD